jgi:hypothetical protein
MKPIVMSPSLNKEFGEFISQGKDLSDVLEWIKDKADYNQLSLSEFLGDSVILADKNPGDIFDYRDLERWATDNGFSDNDPEEKELSDFTSKEIRKYVVGNFDLDDIWNVSDLENWAEERGFSKMLDLS